MNNDCPRCNIGNPGVYVKDGKMYCQHRPEVRRWNTIGNGVMQEHNGDLIRSGFGPYVLAEDYDRLSRTLDAVDKARAIERKARQRLQTELLALCTQHVGGELDPDNANPAGNSHHE